MLDFLGRYRYTHNEEYVFCKEIVKDTFKYSVIRIIVILRQYFKISYQHQRKRIIDSHLNC